MKKKSTVKVRKTWGPLNPVTRIKKSKTRFSRKKRIPDDDFYVV